MNGGFREFGYVAHSSRRAAETAVGPRREAQTGAAPMPERKGRPRRQGRQNVENPKFEGKIYDRCRDKDETTSFLLWDPFLGAWDCQKREKKFLKGTSKKERANASPP